MLHSEVRCGVLSSFVSRRLLRHIILFDHFIVPIFCGRAIQQLLGRRLVHKLLLLHKIAVCTEMEVRLADLLAVLFGLLQVNGAGRVRHIRALVRGSIVRHV